MGPPLDSADADALLHEPLDDLVAPQIVAHKRDRFHGGTKPLHRHTGVADDAPRGHLQRVYVEQPAGADRPLERHRPHQHVRHAGSADHAVDGALAHGITPLSSSAACGVEESRRSAIRSRAGVTPV